MKHLKRYKSFDEAREDLYQVNKKRDPHIFDAMEEMARNSRNPYHPGLYRFKSFSEAREYDLKIRIEASINGKKYFQRRKRVKSHF